MVFGGRFRSGCGFGDGETALTQLRVAFGASFGESFSSRAEEGADFTLSSIYVCLSSMSGEPCESDFIRQISAERRSNWFPENSSSSSSSLLSFSTGATTSTLPLPSSSSSLLSSMPMLSRLAWLPIPLLSMNWQLLLRELPDGGFPSRTRTMRRRSSGLRMSADSSTSESSAAAPCAPQTRAESLAKLLLLSPCASITRAESIAQFSLLLSCAPVHRAESLTHNLLAASSPSSSTSKSGVADKDDWS
mmetsp:Transcript_10604/g.31301  ORF Transcript_10604/g.31301 Transcript_10604/m.31301 type:complete len:248 (+) Transcript_10604:3450-4193(+)